VRLVPGIVHDLGVIEISSGKSGSAKIPDAQSTALHGIAVQIGACPQGSGSGSPTLGQPNTGDGPDRGQDAPDRLGHAVTAGRVHAVFHRYLERFSRSSPYAPCQAASIPSRQITRLRLILLA
jgi:hypothetical protein